MTPSKGKILSKRTRITLSALVWAIFAVTPLPAADLIYVTLGNDTIVTYDVSLSDSAAIAASAQVFANTNLSSPVGLAFDTSGNLYAANHYNNTISKFDPSGGFVFSWSTGAGAEPRYMAFVPVPEPSTWILGTIATATFGYMARRRKAARA